MVKRSANATWKGDLKAGNGVVSTERGALKETPYNFSGRFGDGLIGTNPEELIAAAHSGCFSMALSGKLGEANLKADRIDTRATLTMDKVDGAMTITGIHLDVEAVVPGAEPAAFAEAAKLAKETCPISRLLANIDITLQARLAH